MTIHRRGRPLGLLLLACASLHHVSGTYSHVRKVAIPDQPIGKETFETDGKEDEETNGVGNGGSRKMKSGKDFKSSKKSKKYTKSYYEDRYYRDSYPRPRMPIPSPTCKFVQG